MSKLLEIIGVVLTIFIIGILGLLGYVKFALPNVGKARDLKVELTNTNIARGEYLANHVMECMNCHSTRNWNEFSGTLTEGTLGKGGESFDHSMGLPGSYYSANITPAGIRDWTDGEIFRAITTGVRKNGKPIFPVMPHPSFAQGDENDIKSVIAYIRTLPSIENQVPESSSDFPMNFIINTIPKKTILKPGPPENDVINYGKYLVTIAACMDCHTPYDKGDYDMSKAFAGGRVFNLTFGTLTSTNITSDKETGIGNWSKDTFIARFKCYVDSNNKPVHLPVGPNDFNTIMPWTMYGGMTQKDLSSMFEYLHTLGPIKNPITKFVPKNIVRL
jgi:mono/diheme cytochrome c family protein